MKIESYIDQEYFKWLYFKVVSPHEKHPSDTYWNLLLQLHRTPFYILVNNDENRAEDGATLRDVFVTEKNFPVDADDEPWFAMDCSIFELIMGVAERYAFESDQSIRNSFWKLMGNLKLDGYNDAWYDNWVRNRVDTLLHVFVERLYYYDGVGGLFPLKMAREDQTKVEIWYQMAAYLEENSSLT